MPLPCPVASLAPDARLGEWRIGVAIVGVRDRRYGGRVTLQACRQHRARQEREAVRVVPGRQIPLGNILGDGSFEKVAVVHDRIATRGGARSDEPCELARSADIAFAPLERPVRNSIPESRSGVSERAGGFGGGRAARHRHRRRAIAFVDFAVTWSARGRWRGVRRTNQQKDAKQPTH
jgi:hypothetical protein